MHVLTEKFFFQFLDIDYFSDCDNGEAPEVRIDDDRLCVCVANDADAGVSFEFVTVAKIVNIQELEEELLSQNMHFAELSSSNTNQTELIALLIIQGRTFVEGIENVFKHIKGSCSMLLELSSAKCMF